MGVGAHSSFTKDPHLDTWQILRLFPLSTSCFPADQGPHIAKTPPPPPQPHGSRGSMPQPVIPAWILTGLRRRQAGREDPLSFGVGAPSDPPSSQGSFSSDLANPGTPASADLKLPFRTRSASEPKQRRGGSTCGHPCLGTLAMTGAGPVSVGALLSAAGAPSVTSRNSHLPLGGPGTIPSIDPRMHHPCRTGPPSRRYPQRGNAEATSPDILPGCPGQTTRAAFCCGPLCLGSVSATSSLRVLGPHQRLTCCRTP